MVFLTAVVPPYPHTAHRMRFWGDNSCNAVIHSMSVVEILGGKPRIDYSDSLTEPSLLLEPQSTNLLPYGEDFSKWDTNGGTTTTSNASISPDGSNNSTLVVSVGGGARVGDNVSIVSGNTYTLSVYLKNNGGKKSIKIGSHTTNQFEIVTINNEWAKYTTTFTANSTVSSSIRILSSGVNVNFYAWGAQLEELPYATSYIPTTGAAATRLGETATNAGDVNVFNSEEGVLYAEIAALAGDDSYRYMGLTDGTSNNRVIILYHSNNDRIRVILSSGGTKYLDEYYTVSSLVDFHKIALKWKVNDFALWVNGVERAIDTSGSVPIGLNTFAFNQAGSSNFYGKVRNLQVFNKALTNRELEILTIQ